MKLAESSRDLMASDTSPDRGTGSLRPGTARRTHWGRMRRVHRRSRCARRLLRRRSRWHSHSRGDGHRLPARPPRGRFSRAGSPTIHIGRSPSRRKIPPRGRRGYGYISRRADRHIPFNSVDRGDNVDHVAARRRSRISAQDQEEQINQAIPSQILSVRGTNTSAGGQDWASSSTTSTVSSASRSVVRAHRRLCRRH